MFAAQLEVARTALWLAIILNKPKLVVKWRERIRALVKKITPHV